MSNNNKRRRINNNNNNVKKRPLHKDDDIYNDELILMIDNYDSFTYNLYQYLCEFGANVKVVRNDQITIEECIKLNPSRIIISPGPGRPENAGISMDIITHFAGRVPILGVCLGHQAICSVYGGNIIHSNEIHHGKTSPIKHTNDGIFKDLPNNFEATRYHSLVCDPKSIPSSLSITATCVNKKEGSTEHIMGVRHQKYTVEGVQFHPESILSGQIGKDLLSNFLKVKGGEW